MRQQHKSSPVESRQGATARRVVLRMLRHKAVLLAVVVGLALVGAILVLFGA